jgi:beta-phosphoglucomutase
MLKAIIFDMDGVLVNSTKYIWESFNVLLKDEGVHFTDKDIKKYLGLSLRDQIQQWKKEYGIKEINLEEFSRKAAEIQLEGIKKEFSPNNALHIFLNKAKAQNIKLAVATSSRRWRAEKILEILHIKDYFEAIVTSEDIHNHKPHPDVFLEAAKRLREHPEECVVFEDAVDGIRAARKGNMKVVAIKTQYQSTEELHEADLIIKDFSEMNVTRLEQLFYTANSNC